jgi:hypothetical protein
MVMASDAGAADDLSIAPSVMTENAIAGHVRAKAEV